MINFLPPQEKKTLLEEENYRLVLVLGFLVFISLTALSLVLLSVEFYVKGQVKSQEIFVKAAEKEFAQFKPLQEKMSLINQDLSIIDSFYQNQVCFTDLLDAVSSKVASGVYLNSFSYEKESSRVKISGFSKNKNILSEFRTKLLNEERFSKVYFPISSWIKPENINFSATFVWSP